MNKSNKMKEVLSNFDSDLNQESLFASPGNKVVNEATDLLENIFESSNKDSNALNKETNIVNETDLFLWNENSNYDNNNNNDVNNNFLIKETNEIVQFSASKKVINENSVKKPVIKVIGIGGAGNNIVEFISKNICISDDVVLYQLNTDSQHLKSLKSNANRFLIESKLTMGMGSGGDPKCGRSAMKDFEKKVYEILQGTDICIIVAGFGKGTGSGGAPVVAEISKSLGILTLAFITMPTSGEGRGALEKAINGLKELKESVDALTTISNEKVFDQVINKNSTLFDVHMEANNEIGESIKMISDIILKPYTQNIDLADVKNFFSWKNNVNFFVTLKSRFKNDEIKDIDKILKRNLNQLIFEQNFVNASSALVLLYFNSSTPTSLYTNTVTSLKQISANKDLDLVYGISNVDSDLIGFDIIAINNDPTVLPSNPTTLLSKENNIDSLMTKFIKTSNHMEINNFENQKTNKKIKQINDKLLTNNLHNKLENDFNDLIETKKLTTDQMNKIINKTFESYFEKKNSNLVTSSSDYDDLNIFKS